MWYCNYFHIQLLIIECLLCFKLQRRSRFWFRAVPAVLLYVAFPALLPGAFYDQFTGWQWVAAACLSMLVLSGFLLGFCLKISFRQVLFYCCVAHTLQHIVFCLHRITILAHPVSYETEQLLMMVYLLVVCIIVFLVLPNRFRESETAEIRNNPLLLFTFVSTLLVYGVSTWMEGMGQETIIARFFDFFSCLLLLMLLLDLFRIRESEREQMILEQLLRQEQEQHELSRATVDVINRKCHDLRHQISALRNMNSDEQEKSIGELEQAVMIYDSFSKSGNKDVDIILAEKSLLAEKNHIVIRSIVDGGRLSFLKVEDLFSLLGNALDNAIDAAGQEQEEERRIITLNAMARENLYTIHLENPCAREPLFVDGLPVTTKPDTDYHGYGMRSMRYLCEKYKGVLTCGWEDGIFTLDILFPLEEKPTASE